MADGHGGARPNSGRPAGSKNRVPSKAAEAQQQFAAFIIPHLEEYFVELHNMLNDPLVPPNVRLAAIRELLDRGMGKPREFLELESSGPQVSAAELLNAWEEKAAPATRRRKKDQEAVSE
jgi:hypothetical protein